MRWHEIEVVKGDNLNIEVLKGLLDHAVDVDIVLGASENETVRRPATYVSTNC